MSFLTRTEFFNKVAELEAALEHMGGALSREIEEGAKLRAENERLRAALKPFADEFYENGNEIHPLSHKDDETLVWIEGDLTAGDFRRAHAAVLDLQTEPK